MDCLKLLELDVPSHKLVGEGVKLVCRFDMEGDALYSVKWYRNEQEFYRFVPNDRPKLQIFPQHGIRVEVLQFFIVINITSLCFTEVKIISPTRLPF